MTPADIDTRDRVIRLEAQVEHLATTIDDMAGKLDEVHGALQQARGMRWLVMVMWIGVGGALATALNALRLFGGVVR